MPAKQSTGKLKRKLAPDLNRRFDVSTRAVRMAAHRFEHPGSLTIWFDGIEGRLVNALSDPRVASVVACSPWFSNQTVLRAMAALRGGCAIVTNMDKDLNSKVRTDAFRRLRVFGGYERVRKISAGRGRLRAIPHQKCFVLLDDGGRPFACIYGSWNCSGSAGTNLELMTHVEDAGVATAMYDEWRRVYGIAKTHVA